jgi:formate hydrogenlyase subunit 4
VNGSAFVPPALAVLFAPLMLGVINRTKALAAGRTGQPLAQAYFDIVKLLRKGAVYSETTTWIFRAGPIFSLAAALTACALVPFAGFPAPLSFRGDFVLLACLLGLMRFATVAAALDTGSSFEGMGASRELAFSALAEPALFLAFAGAARRAGGLSLADLSLTAWPGKAAALLLAGAALFVVYLAENSRIPFDDPNTHLELTMVHEVMVLDHGGPDFAFVLYGAALKLWVIGAVLIGLVVPVSGPPWERAALALAAMAGLAVLTGIVESTLARLRLTRVPHLLLGAGACSLLALLLSLR